MKRKVIIPFLLFCSISLTLTVFITWNLNTLFNNEKASNLSGDKIVKVNDVLKNAQGFLQNGEESSLSFALKQNNYELSLYDLDGKVIFDSKNKSNIGKQYPMNNILSSVNIDKKTFTINFIDKGEKKFALVILDIHEEKVAFDTLKNNSTALVWALYVMFIIIMLVIFVLIYVYVLRPFKKLENFAGEVAKGNLEIPLVRERHNAFGAFAWAFDMLRNELKTSRQREAEADRTKKELVAVLSHDIRTPIASIKAYGECLKSLPDKNTERSNRYIDVIIQKTDEITKLSQDMFIHAISDLEKLEITPSEYLSREILNNIIEPLILHYQNRIRIMGPIPEVKIFTDKFRLAQVFENIVSNSAKYANFSDIEIDVFIDKDMLKCSFKDSGEGVLPEEMPFIFDKFYRGKKAKDSGEAGSGLGLYISKYILDKTRGQISASNYFGKFNKGFVIEVSIKII
ncbi:MAG: HAMP domain-containing histidine kinase [Clostridiaceae bacterium]|nr:HAMP domain-containing histidine kinase [Clostridiaceae bacterium]